MPQVHKRDVDDSNSTRCGLSAAEDVLFETRFWDVSCEICRNDSSELDAAVSRHPAGKRLGQRND